MTEHKSGWMVALLGARMHWAVPRILNEAGILAQLFTDFTAGSGWSRFLNLVPARVRPGFVKRMIDRTPPGLKADAVTAFNWFGIEYARRRARAKTPPQLTATFLWANKEFCRRVCVSDWRDAGGVFVFNGAGLEIMQRAKREAKKTIVEQTIAPSAVERRLLAEERQLHPGWEATEPNPELAEYIEREQAEWGLADIIVCGSQFVRDGIAECGGPAERCVVVPYGVEGHGENQKTENRKQKSDELGESRGPRVEGRGSPQAARLLRVLTVGGVGLRKGSPYVLEAAKRLKGVAEFRMVGPALALPEAEKELRAHVELIGPVPRSEVARHYAWADVFLLPSICEGSATVTYEALAAGVPVICTPNCGSVVRDGEDGFIVPIRDVERIVSCVAGLEQHRHRLVEMSARARETARRHNLQAYAARFMGALAGEAQA